MNPEKRFSTDVSPGDVVAIGDVHGRYDLLTQMVSWLRGSGARVVMLGDLIDRGGQDIEVLQLVKSLLDDPDSYGLDAFYCLKGNHEQMFTDAALTDGLPEMVLWVKNGGNVSKFEEMVEEHLDWVKELPVLMQIGDTLFVHAGLVPSEDPKVTIQKGNADTLMWIRNPFLKKGARLHKWTDRLKKVVHGHTITGDKLPTNHTDRVNLDTGAFMTGVLSAYNVTKNTFNQIKGEPNAAYGAN